MITKTRKNGVANKLDPLDEPVHNWYRFVLSFPPHLVREYLQKYSIHSKHHVFDPFCGTGTTLVECKKLGIPSIGLEANPMAAFASKVKTDWAMDAFRLKKTADDIYDSALNELEHQGLSDLPGLWNEAAPSLSLRSLNDDQMRLLLKNSISPLPLHKSLTLLDLIHHRTSRYTDHQKLAFAKTLVESASNLHFGPEVGVRNLKEDAPVLMPWINEIHAYLEDLKQFRDNRNVESKVVCGDARNTANYLQPKSVDFVFTSPPYPNEKDYTRTTRLESVLLGFVADRGELRSFKQHLLRSNTRNVYKVDDDDRFIDGHKKINQIAKSIEQRRLDLGKTSGFERLYHRVTKLYFGGMARHFIQMRSILKPGAILAYVVGDQASYLQVMIRTGQLLAEIAESLGYTVIGIDLFRTRLATATKEYLNEEVLILQWKGDS